jgi:hypothetical protein
LNVSSSLKIFSHTKDNDLKQRSQDSVVLSYKLTDNVPSTLTLHRDMFTFICWYLMWEKFCQGALQGGVYQRRLAKTRDVRSNLSASRCATHKSHAQMNSPLSAPKHGVALLQQYSSVASETPAVRPYYQLIYVNKVFT